MVLVLLLAGCGGQAHPARITVTVAPAARAGTATVKTVPAGSDPRSPQLRHLQAVISGSLRHDGSAVGVLVQDLDTGQLLYSRAARVRRPPASLEKLYTSVALLDLLGPEARLHTDVLGTGHLSPGGVWHGNLYLRGDGDPTFGDGTFNRFDEHGYGPTAGELAAQLRAAGIRRVTGRLFADASRFDRAVAGPATAEQPDTPDYGGELSALVYDHGLTGGGLGPAVFAAHELALTLRSQKVFVLASRALTVTPLDARPLATVASPRLPILLRLMDVPSDDLFAELLTKQLGYHFVHRGTLAAGALQIREALATAFHLAPLIYDGSGLDKADRSSPEEIVALLRKVWRTADGSILHGALPVVGRTGTVQTIGVNTPAAGRCSAKTGTLNYVTNLAGYCAAADHHTLAFALMIDGPGNWTALTAISRIVGAIAAY